MFHNTGLGIFFISGRLRQPEPDSGHGFLGLGHDGDPDLHLDADFLGVHLETGPEVEAGMAGVWVEVAARFTRVYAVQPRLLQEG